MPELKDVINDLPPELQTDGDDDQGTADAVDNTANEDQNVDNQDQNTDDDGDATADDNTDDSTDDDSNDEDYDVDLGDEDKDKTATDPAAGVTPPPATDENTYIIQNLTKIQTRVVMPDDSVKTVDVYGWGDLPRDMKGFATPYEQGIFTQAAAAQELRARDLQGEFRNKKVQADTEVYVQRENRAIAEDLTELRQEGWFPKFKGMPGSKEFNESAGAKEFDRVVAYMNEQNDKYGTAATSGKAYRHIGFREAFIMLNGPNPKAADKAEDKARREVAGKLKSSRGTGTDSKVVSNKRVTNITELADEFAQFAGQGAV